MVSTNGVATIPLVDHASDRRC